MRVELQTNRQVLWKCPLCGHLELEDTGEDPPVWDCVEVYCLS